MKKESMSLSVKIVIIVLSALIISTAAVGILSYVLNREAAVKLNAEKALAISNSVAAAADPSQFAAIMKDKEKNDYWYWFKEYVDEVLQKNDLMYLYVLDRNYGDMVTYFAEGYDPASGEDEVEFLAQEDSEPYHSDMFMTIDQGTETSTGIYDSDGFGHMVSGFSPIMDKSGNVIGVVGVDISVEDVVASSNRFGLIIIGIVLGLCAVMGIVITGYIRRSVGNPIRSLTAAAEKIAQGDMEVSIQAASKDEIGMLVDSFSKMIESTKQQASALETLAAGDLTANISPRCDQDVMSHAMVRMVENLRSMFKEINTGTDQVSGGAKQMADGAQTLASGASQQAAAVEEFSAALMEVQGKTKSNAENSRKALEITNRAGELMGQSMESMQAMLAAMQHIDESSKSINRIIKVIEDIAFQTNILALNAAVEAARAGQHGKGFAVVAEEVRNLASKSAAAAKETSDLILSSSERVREGSGIVERTNAGLAMVAESSAENLLVIQEIANSSEEQARSISEISFGIDQISSAVQANSAVAEESAASSQQMSSQAEVLRSLVKRFKL